MNTHTFRIDGMHCASCALLIDDTLVDLPGVHDTRTSKKTGLAIVEIDPTVTTPQHVISAIAELGYTATAAPS
ncbi:heavy-metal-associated domain-containing protein [Nocardia sp. NPDC004415]